MHQGGPPGRAERPVAVGAAGLVGAAEAAPAAFERERLGLLAEGAEEEALQRGEHEEEGDLEPARAHLEGHHCTRTTKNGDTEQFKNET